MKKVTIRAGFVVLLLTAVFLLPSPAHGTLGSALWGTLWAIAFAGGNIYFTGRALLFIPLTVFMLTAVLPFVILCIVGLNAYGSWAASASQVVRQIHQDDPLGGLSIFIPTIGATISDWLIVHLALTSASRRPPSAAPDA